MTDYESEYMYTRAQRRDKTNQQGSDKNEIPSKAPFCYKTVEGGSNKTISEKYNRRYRLHAHHLGVVGGSASLRIKGENREMQEHIKELELINKIDEANQIMEVLATVYDKTEGTAELQQKQFEKYSKALSQLVKLRGEGAGFDDIKDWGW